MPNSRNHGGAAYYNRRTPFSVLEHMPHLVKAKKSDAMGYKTRARQSVLGHSLRASLLPLTLFSAGWSGFTAFMQSQTRDLLPIVTVPDGPAPLGSEVSYPVGRAMHFMMENTVPIMLAAGAAVAITVVASKAKEEFSKRRMLAAVTAHMPGFANLPPSKRLKKYQHMLVVGQAETRQQLREDTIQAQETWASRRPTEYRKLTNAVLNR